jgi:hypothetical protein
MQTVSITRTSGLQIYAFPDRSEGFSIADWITHREPMIEGTGANVGIYIGDLDESKATLWRFFVGNAQPQWNQDIGHVKLPGQSGQFAITFDLKDSQDVAIARAQITIKQSGQIVASDSSSSLGVKAFNLDAGTYTYSITASGFQSIVDQSFVVSANATINVTMTRLGSTPSDPGYITGLYLVLDEDGNPNVGVEATLSCDENVNAEDGIAISTAERTVTSDSNGMVSFTNLVPGFSYTISIGSYRQYSVTIPIDATSPLDLRSIVI